MSNYLLIFVLNIFNIYSTLILWMFLFLELSIILKYKYQIKTFLIQVKLISLNECEYLKKNSFHLLCAIIGIGLICEPIYNIVKNEKEGFLQVFHLGDVLAYYAKWAREWYNGIIPKTEFFRPQLWSANISLIYKFFGNEYYEFFGKQIFNIIFIYFILAIIGICLTGRSLVYFFGTIFGVYFSLTGTFTQGYSGYMEVPLSLTFMFFLVFAYDVKFRNININKYKYIYAFIISSIFLTKELGWIFILGIFAYFYFFYKLTYNQEKISLYNFLKILIFVSFIFLPFYFYSFYYYDLFSLDNPVFKLLFFDTSTHIIAGHGERYLNLNTRLIDGLGKTPDYLVAPLLLNLLFFITKEDIIKYVVSPFVIIYYTIWIFMMSNEFRYLYPIITISYFSSFIIAYDIYKKVTKIKLFAKTFTFLLILSLFVIILTNKKIPNKNTVLNIVDNKKILHLDGDDKILVSNFIKNYENNNNNRILTNVYALNDVGLAVLKNVKIIYKDKINYEEIQNYDYIVMKGNCKNLEKKQYKIIFNKHSKGCIIKLNN